MTIPGRPVVALVGATGAAGGTLLRILEERAFPVADLRLMASERSVGSELRALGRSYRVEEATDDRVADCDVVFLAAGSGTARRLAPIVAAGGGVAIDKSSAYRLDPSVPLVVPEVNAETLVHHRGIIANPNCVAIPLTVAMAPLDREAGLRHLTVVTYQSASGGGRRLVDELQQQVLAEAAGRPPRADVYPHVLHGNVVPGGWTMVGDDTEEELKIIEETRRVLAHPDLPISVATVRVPVAVGHSVAVFAEFAQSLTADAARRILAQAPGVRLVDDPAEQRYPTPRDAAGTDDVLVGRIRQDRGRAGALALFLCADNLRKGAATNAVQVAELVMNGTRPVRPAPTMPA